MNCHDAVSTPHSGTRRGRERAHRIEAETQDIVSPPGAVERPMAELWGDGGVSDMGSVPGSNSNSSQSDCTHFVRCWGSHTDDQHPTRGGAPGTARTDAEERGEGDALPPPVHEPERGAGEGGLPRGGQGDIAPEGGGDERLDRGAEAEEEDAEEDVAEYVAGGPEWVLLKKVLGNRVVELLESDRRRHEWTREPGVRLSMCTVHVSYHGDFPACAAPREAGPRRRGVAHGGEWAHLCSYSGPWLNMMVAQIGGP